MTVKMLNLNLFFIFFVFCNIQKQNLINLTQTFPNTSSVIEVGKFN